MSDERIKKLAQYAEDFFINKLDHDPVDPDLSAFVEGFIEGVLAHEKGVV